MNGFQILGVIFGCSVVGYVLFRRCCRALLERNELKVAAAIGEVYFTAEQVKQFFSASPGKWLFTVHENPDHGSINELKTICSCEAQYAADGQHFINVNMTQRENKKLTAWVKSMNERKKRTKNIQQSMGLLSALQKDLAQRQATLIEQSRCEAVIQQQMVSELVAKQVCQGSDRATSQATV